MSLEPTWMRKRLRGIIFSIFALSAHDGKPGVTYLDTLLDRQFAEALSDMINGCEFLGIARIG